MVPLSDLATGVFRLPMLTSCDKGSYYSIGWRCLCLRIENRAHKTHIFANGMWRVMGVGWGGGVNVLSSAYRTYFYAPEISGMLDTLHVATESC